MGMKVVYSDKEQVRTYYLQPEGKEPIEVFRLHVINADEPPDLLDVAVCASVKLNCEIMLQKVLKALGYGHVEIRELGGF